MKYEEELNSNEIKEVFLDYIKDETYNYAIMLDGDWGCGKTYFIKELIPSLKQILIENKIIYISLYGIKDLKDVTKSIYMESYFKPKNKKKLMQVASIGTDLAFEFFKNKGIKLNQKKTSEFIGNFFKLDNSILIFDDLERCQLPINEVLGYINSFVEQNELKVIIVTNEKEIGSFNDQKPNKEKEEYFKIKEKLVGNTIVYKPNIEKTLSQLIKSLKSKNELKDNLLKEIPYFIRKMEEQNHINFRTFQFYLSKISKIYNLLYSNKITNNEGKDEFINFIIQEMFPICCTYKKELPDKEKNNNSYYSLPLNTSINLRHITEFVSTASLTSSQLQELLDIHYNNLSSFAKEPYQNLQKLKYIYEMEEKDVVELIKKIERDVKDKKFQITDFCQIIYQFICIENIGFEEKYLNQIVEQMENLIKNEVDLGNVNILSNNYYQEMLNSQKINTNRYLVLVQNLKSYLFEKSKTLNEKNIDELLKYPDFIKRIQIKETYKGTLTTRDIISDTTPQQLLPIITQNPSTVFGFLEYLSLWRDDYCIYEKVSLIKPIDFYINYFKEFENLLNENTCKDIILKYDIKLLINFMKEIYQHLEKKNID